MSQHLSLILQQLEHAGNVYIQPHNIPDPDSIASSFGLKTLLAYHGIESTIIHVGSIEKANSKKMVELFDIKMRVLDQINYHQDDYVILVDSQVGNSNITNLFQYNQLVVDHHEVMPDICNYLYRDIRAEVGACASIITSYFHEADIPIPQHVATALLYGIMMDTDNLTRRASNLDIEMFYFLYNQANISLIKSLKLNQIVKSDLIAYAKALDSVEIYGYLGFVHIADCNDSLLGTISDMVNTIEGVSVVVAYAKRNDGVKFSIRSESHQVKANKLVRYIISDLGVGGGHGEMAGGFMLADRMDFMKNKQLDTYIRHRAITYVEKVDVHL